MTRALSVWWDKAITGTLEVSRNGNLRFVYSADWLSDESRPAISFSLPRRPEPFRTSECRPFFAGLLPEAGQREAVAGALGISARNDFALLDALGGDVAGALSLWPEGETPPSPEPDARPRALGDEDLASVLDTLPARPLLVGREGVRLSLAGAQPKLPVVLVGGRVALPAPGQPTTHILKPPVTRFPHTTENEALVMRLADALGLPVASVEPRVVAGRPYLLITRYDRRIDEPGPALRLHQEDFCQALAIPPERKYQAEGGPTFAMSFELLRRAATHPAIAVLALLDAAVFNLIAGNADAHGKNFSLLHDTRTVSLAPLYDLLSTAAYPELSPNLAMRIGRRTTLDQIGPDTWTAFAKEAGLAAPFVRRRARELADAVRTAVNDVADRTATAGLDREALAAVASRIATRAERVARTGTPALSAPRPPAAGR